MPERREAADLPRRHGDTERIEGERANAVAIMGWGHLVCPFLCGREVEVRPGFTEDLRRRDLGRMAQPRIRGVRVRSSGQSAESAAGT